MRGLRVCRTVKDRLLARCLSLEADYSMILRHTYPLRSICDVQSSWYRDVRVIRVVTLIKDIVAIPSRLKIQSMQDLAVPKLSICI